MTLQFFLPCASGVEDMLALEVARVSRIRPDKVLTQRGGVMALGDWADMLALNLHCRLAQRVLIQLSLTPYRGEDDIYQAACDVLWEEWFTPRHTFKIDITATRSPLQSINFAALRIKDGICDRFRHFEGERPSVDTDRPDARIYAHLTQDHLTLSIDTSGEALFKRGWRFDKGDAPLKETLAAAMLEASGWAEQARQLGADAAPLVDPCCGSGTIGIEAAQILIGMPAGHHRRFGFERLLPHEAPQVAQWNAIKSEATESMNAVTKALKGTKNSPECLIFGSDLAFRMVDFANTNAERAGVADFVNFRGGDALQRAAPIERVGMIVMNPPYGERIEARGVGGRNRAEASFNQAPRQSRDAEDTSQREVDTDFFAKLATHWKRAYPGWTAWILSPDMKLPGAMRFKETRRVPLWNGPIECRLFRFDLMAGSPRPQVDAAQFDT